MIKVRLAVLAVSLVLFGGCASNGESYPGHSGSSSSHKHLSH